MADGGEGSGGVGTGSDNLEGLTPLPQNIRTENLTDHEKLVFQKNRSCAFTPPANGIKIPMLEGAKNCDHWYNTILGICEMAHIDGIFTGHDLIPVDAFEKETEKNFNERSVYWKTANKYITGTIRSSLKPGGLSHITGILNAFKMVQKLRGQYKSKGYTTREVV